MEPQVQHRGTQTIETERLVLRRFEADDAQAMYDHWASSDTVTRYLLWPTHPSVDESRRVLAEWIAAYASPEKYEWAIVPRELGQPVGSIGAFGYDEATCSIEVGYVLGERWWHQGYMSEALGAVIDYLFGQVGLLRVWAEHDPANPHSGMVMRHCGMVYEGTLRQAHRNNQGICDTCVHGILRAEWEARRAGAPRD